MTVQDPLLRIAQVIEMTGLSRTTIYRLIKGGRFPAPHKPGGYSARWSFSAVRQWVDDAKPAP